ncbi:glycine--tRNA ligase subunit beta [Altererythrobacter sp. ZODW24]|uniref:glycine--tRNA ligase subunit beta n=1 Tax=Altererythrobacter sp. ZODW24 TaxID=2185142 RepID=UPI000DF7BC29|nr:glycine--tRNA ligase subunit beta [Altererythrobacter sp. ZODW24]
MSDFLLELRSEEIPARMQKGARGELEKLFRREMDAAGVSIGEVTVYSTPRRLALIARDLPQETEAVSEEAKGPPEGAPDQAVDGFCRKNGVTRDQLEVRDVKGRNTYFAVINKPGRAVTGVLAEAIPAIIRDFSWPKSQRWGAASISTESLRWVRPLSGIVALLGNEIVECEVHGVTSGAVTLGHRFHHSGDITIGGADDYAMKLRAAHVIVDHEERQDIIRTGAAKAAQDAGLALVEDEGLVIENAGLTEWPVPLLGRFEDDFLEVPPETIQLTARVNQKYFVCEDADGKLANAFICTANIEAEDPGVVVEGNRRVLAARLSDAKFFWDVDRKKTLADHAEGLARITFHEKLGTVADKVERVAKLAEWLASEGIVPDCDPALARHAAELCKADLVTEMVGEFPELQGLMGGYYARAEGLPDAVADAIRDHYKPVGQGDDVPTAPITVAVSLADKLDTLSSFFAVDEKPTGSKDPFALRRAALGMLRLIEQGLRFDFARATRCATGNLFAQKDAALSSRDLAFDDGAEVTSFLVDRLKVQQREAGVRHDLIDAVFALGGEDDLVRLLARVHALQAFMESDDGANLLAGYKRAANILKKEDWSDVQKNSLSYTPEPAEKALIDALDAAEPKAAASIESEDFGAAMAALASLRAPIDAFFEDVTVNDDDQDKRAARLGLLLRFRNAVHTVADFARIEG